jgi:hypothetical protein
VRSARRSPTSAFAAGNDAAAHLNGIAKEFDKSAAGPKVTEARS